ncbi:acyl-coenzyme A thioesterase 13-like [Lucilia cuprina]|uniref:acyl-coenzyme A thioesterase 13-like n=1 Tax=Lucilia cuprina TaxID=7375 RepID=UPI000C71A657|nr:acyl-coenzyme A thioesterase 13-like [Lucilia cuprina]
MSSKSGVDFLRNLANYCVKLGGYDTVLKACRITDGGKGRCIGEFTISKEHLNGFGTLHGGYAVTIIDNMSTYALMSADSHPGVSVDLSVSFLKSAKEGEVLVFDAKTIKIGKNMAFIDCVLKKKSDDSIVVKGSQTKYVDFNKEEFKKLHRF